MKTVHEEAKALYKRFHNLLFSHCNPLIRNFTVLTIPGNLPRRLNGVVTFSFPHPNLSNNNKKIILVVNVINGWLLTSRILVNIYVLLVLFLVVMGRYVYVISLSSHVLIVLIRYRLYISNKEKQKKTYY